ncbi:MAG: redox-sensing transcriptional repressor Rex [Erysipelotrichaceae bacterium]
MNNLVPKSTLHRYPIYLKALRKLQNSGQNRILSSELANLVDIKPTTIRRDFSFLGSLGKQGYGYDIEALIEIFSFHLGLNFEEKIILVGVGNLGKAILNYNRWDHVVGEIVCGFDIKPTNDLGIPVYNILDLPEKKPEGCRIAIITASDNIQETVDMLVENGILGIVDFTHEHINVPKGVLIKYVDVVSAIQELVFDTNQLHGEK